MSTTTFRFRIGPALSAAIVACFLVSLSGFVSAWEGAKSATLVTVDRLMEEVCREKPFPARRAVRNDKAERDELRLLSIEAARLFVEYRSELLDVVQTVQGPSLGPKLNLFWRETIREETCVVTAQLAGVSAAMDLSKAGVKAPAMSGHRFSAAYSLLCCGRVSEAVQLGEGIVDPFFRCPFLLQLSRSDRARGNQQAAVKAARSAVPLARTLDPLFCKCKMLAWAAVELSRGGDTAGADRVFAEATAVAMQREPLLRSGDLGDVATAQARVGRFSDGLSTAEKIERGPSQDAAFSAIAVEAAKAGDLKLAISILQKLSTPIWRATARGRLAEVRQARGERAEALALWDEASQYLDGRPEPFACQFYRELLDDRIRFGELKGIKDWFAKAFWLADKEPNPAGRQAEYRKFAKRWYRVPGHVSEGRKAFDQALLALGAPGDPIMDALSDKSIWRDAGRQVVGEAAIDVGDVEYARRLAEKMQDHAAAPDLRIPLAEKLAEIGDVAGAIEQWALVTKQAIDPNYRDKGAVGVVHGLTKSGNTAAARVVAGRIENLHWHAVAVGLIAKAAVQNSDEDAVLAWVKGQPPGASRMLGLLGFVEGAMARHGICGCQFLDSTAALSPPEDAEGTRRLLEELR